MWKFRKLFGHFEKAPGSTPETNINLRERRDILLLTLLRYWLVYLCKLLSLEDTRPMVVPTQHVCSRREPEA